MYRLRLRKGISPIVALLVVVAITVGVGAAVYYFFYSGLSRSSTAVLKEFTVSAKATTNTITIEVRNTGGTKITIDKITVAPSSDPSSAIALTHLGGTNLSGATIDPGATASGIYKLGTAQNPGTELVVIVEATTPDGSTIVRDVRVIVG